MAHPLLNEAENRRASEFAMKHYAKHNKTASVIVTATATGVGYGVKVECPYCHKTKDVTDCSDW